MHLVPAPPIFHAADMPTMLALVVVITAQMSAMLALVKRSDATALVNCTLTGMVFSCSSAASSQDPCVEHPSSYTATAASPLLERHLKRDLSVRPELSEWQASLFRMKHLLAEGGVY